MDNPQDTNLIPNAPISATEAMEEDNMSGKQINITIQYHGSPVHFSLPSSSRLSDLADQINEELDVPLLRQKLYITPKVGIIKPPFTDQTNLSISTLLDKKIVLMGSTVAETIALSKSISRASMASSRKSIIPKALPARTRDPKKAQEEAMYSFHSIRPLPYFRNAAKSQAMLEKLASDAGIKAAMRKWHFSVGLLTEMDPAEHTTHESRTLGLNRNAGEVIELRLRTDAYDGYRDYKTIRKTLCHELAHNTWGEHDSNFWKLCREIEAVVERDDWTRGGRSVSSQVYYEPSQEELDHVDGGGWAGGEFTVGRKPGASSDGEMGLSRREILAKAAEERAKRAREGNAES